MERIANYFPVVAVIPSLNPDERFLQTVAGLLQVGFSSVILVDDGSRVECQKYFEEFEGRTGCTVLHHETNRGKGQALKTAFSYYLKHFDQQAYFGVVTADADGQHLPLDIYRTASQMCVKTESSIMPSPPKLVLGSRNFAEEGVPTKSRSGNRITTAVFRLLYRKHIEDTQTGLRAIPNAFLSKCLEIPGERFEYEINMLITAVSEKLVVEEVPIQTVYFEGNRETHFRPVIDSIKIYSVFLKYVLASTLTATVDYLVFTISYLVVNDLKVSMILGRICATFVSFFTQKKFVFSYTSKATKVFVKFVLLVICSGLLSYWAIQTASTIFHTNVFLLKLLIESAVYFINYYIQKNFVWKK